MIYCWAKSHIETWMTFLSQSISNEYNQSKKELSKLSGSFDNKPIYLRTKRPELFFLLEIIILLFIVFSLYHWYTFFSYLANETSTYVTPNWDITDISYDNLEKIELVREGWMKWYEYFYRQDPYSPENMGNYYIEMGNLIRPFFNYIINYILPAFILGYCVWFFIKYYDYVIAAMWGFYVMLYTFVTKKIECKLAEKWYIKFVTGWKKCSPSFSKYLMDWYRRFIQRPLRQQQLNYVRAYDSLRTFKGWDWLYVFIDSLKLAISNTFKMIIDFFKKIWKIIYNFFMSIGDVFMKMWHFILSLFGISYTSESNIGTQCECPTQSVLDKIQETVPILNTPSQQTSTNNTNTNTNSLNKKCNDSFIIDIIILSIIMYPIFKYMNISFNQSDLFIQPIQSFLHHIAQSLNVSYEIVVSVSTILFAILFYSFDRYIHS